MQGSEDPFTMLTAASEKVHIRYGQVHLCVCTQVQPGTVKKFLLSNSKTQPGLSGTLKSIKLQQVYSGITSKVKRNPYTMQPAAVLKVFSAESSEP